MYIVNIHMCMYGDIQYAKYYIMILSIKPGCEKARAVKSDKRPKTLISSKAKKLKLFNEN